MAANASKVRDPRFWERWRMSRAVSGITAKLTQFVSETAEFLYPLSRQFPFDEVCGHIVRELELRHWRVPGITVEFHNYGSGAQKFRAVSRIKSRDFMLWFCRKQRTMPDGVWNDTAAVTEIIIPQQELHVYQDESGPTYYRYAGDDWERDREKFMSDSKVNSKLRGEPRTYLQYKGECNCRGLSLDELAHLSHTHPGQRSPLLAHTNDLGREYDPCHEEQMSFKAADVFEEFKRYLKDVVLKAIMSHPVPTKQIAPTATRLIPLPSRIGPIFCFGEHREAHRIQQGQEDVEKLIPAERYALSVRGRRLVPHGTPNDGSVPKIAYEGFLWCGIGQVDTTTDIASLEIPGHYRWSDSEQFVIRIKPNRANDIYIADHCLYGKRRQELGEAMGNDRDEFTGAEVADFMRARARSIVPIDQYRGGYREPVVLINRELGFDEVEIVSGPHRERRYAEAS